MKVYIQLLYFFLEKKNKKKNNCEKVKIYDEEKKIYLDVILREKHDDFVIYTLPLSYKDEQFTSVENVLYSERKMVTESKYVKIYFLANECSYIFYFIIMLYSQIYELVNEGVRLYKVRDLNTYKVYTVDKFSPGIHKSIL